MAALLLWECEMGRDLFTFWWLGSKRKPKEVGSPNIPFKGIPSVTLLLSTRPHLLMVPIFLSGTYGPLRVAFTSKPRHLKTHFVLRMENAH
jgi:hypothetical protein